MPLFSICQLIHNTLLRLTEHFIRYGIIHILVTTAYAIYNTAVKMLSATSVHYFYYIRVLCRQYPKSKMQMALGKTWSQKEKYIPTLQQKNFEIKILRTTVSRVLTCWLFWCISTWILEVVRWFYSNWCKWQRCFAIALRTPFIFTPDKNTKTNSVGVKTLIYLIKVCAPHDFKIYEKWRPNMLAYRKWPVTCHYYGQRKCSKPQERS